MTVFYAESHARHHQAINQIRKADAEKGLNISAQNYENKAIHSIQIHLDNGMSSPLVPFFSLTENEGSQQLITDYNYKHMVKIQSV